MVQMTKTENAPRRRLALVAVFGALAAGAVLYETALPAGKAASDCPAASSALAAKLAPLAKGDLAALVIARAPRLALPLSFERQDGSKLTLADFQGRAVL